MKSSYSEKSRAEQLTAAVDQLIRDPQAPMPPLAVADEELLRTARRLAALPALLGPVDPALETRIARQARRQAEKPILRGRMLPRFRLAWAAGGLALALLVVALLTPFGQTAIASFMSVFHLGQTVVSITPIVPEAVATVEAEATGISQSLTLDEAQKLPYPILQPAALPSGYSLRSITGYTYPDLPAWVPQPFSVELTYAKGQKQFSLRLYPISLGTGDRLNISRMNLAATPIQNVEDVDVGGRPGVLLQVGSGGKTVLQELVWEQDNLLLSLFSANLAEADMLAIARSVH